MQLWDNLCFPFSLPTRITKHKKPLFLVGCSNTKLLDRAFSHKSLFEQWATHGCTFKGRSSIQNGCSIIEKHLVMGVLTLLQPGLKGLVSRLSQTVVRNLFLELAPCSEERSLGDNGVLSKKTYSLPLWLEYLWDGAKLILRKNHLCHCYHHRFHLHLNFLAQRAFLFLLQNGLLMSAPRPSEKERERGLNNLFAGIIGLQPLQNRCIPAF